MNPMQMNPMALASQQLLNGGVQPNGPMGGVGGAAAPMIPPGILPPAPPGLPDPTQMAATQGMGGGLDPRKMAYVKALMGGR